MEGFEYVINAPPVPKVAFGSSLPRETLPREGKCLSPFMRRHVGEVRDFPAPWDYNPNPPRHNIHTSKKGYSSFVNINPRELPPKEPPYPMTEYNIEIIKPLKLPKKPFDISDPPEPKWKFSPGPGYYQTENPIQKLQPDTIFGTIRKFSPAIKTVCTPVNKAMCYICEKMPIGDYFRDFNLKLDLCRPCMKLKQEAVKACGIDHFTRLDMIEDLKRFEQCRYCDFKHLHHGTNAAVQVLTKLELLNKYRIENYLFPYMKDKIVD